MLRLFVGDLGMLFCVQNQRSKLPLSRCTHLRLARSKSYRINDFLMVCDASF